MDLNTWEAVLVATLVINAALALGYRVYRLSKGGPMADVIGQGVLAFILVATAGAIAGGIGWTRWIAFGYALLFGLIVMPIWTLAILIPMEPRRADYAFTAIYWGSLFLVGVAAVLA